MNYLPLLLIPAAVLLTYGRTLAFEFVDWDDNINVYQNPLLTSPSWDGFFRIWSQPYGELYIPLVYTSYLFEIIAAGMTPAIMHLSNLLAHCASGLCVYFILRRIAPSTAAALIGALVFCVHPLQAEPVSWITGRKDLLGGLFSLLALLLFSYALDSRNKMDYAAASLMYLLALLSKPSSVVVPLMAGALALYRQTPWKRMTLILLPWVGLAGIWTVISMIAQTAGLRQDTPFILPIWQRPLVAADSLVYYAGKMIWPSGLSPITPRNIHSVAASPWIWVKLLGVLAVVLVLAKQRGLPALCGALFALPLLPVLGLTPYFFQYFSTVADRYCYLSLSGYALAIGCVIAMALRMRPQWNKHIVVVSGLIVALYAGAGFLQSGCWHDSIALWRRQIAVDPNSSHAHHNLASNLALRGDVAQARAEYEKTLDIDPYYERAYQNLIRLAQIHGQPDEAAKAANRALALKPNSLEANMTLGMANLVLERYADAAAAFRGAVSGAPEDAEAYNGWARRSWAWTI
ncbi:MAG: tetratricopeptide repeat protein [bacterium]